MNHRLSRSAHRTSCLLCQFLPADQVLLLVLNQLESRLIQLFLRLCEIDLCVSRVDGVRRSVRRGKGDKTRPATVSPFHVAKAEEKLASTAAMMMGFIC